MTNRFTGTRSLVVFMLCSSCLLVTDQEVSRYTAPSQEQIEHCVEVAAQGVKMKSDTTGMNLDGCTLSAVCVCVYFYLSEDQIKI